MEVNKMKRLACAALALVALSGAAWSADLSPAPYYKAPAYAPVYNWTGFYIGGNGGGGFGYSKWDTTTSFNPSGGVAGGTLGYNYQLGAAVLGVESDIDWAGLSGSAPGGFRTSDSWLSTVRARLGYAAGRFMPYVTAGGAFGDIRASGPGLAGSTTANAGWTAGAGLEFAVAPHWTIKAEYLYVDLGKFNCGVGCGVPIDNVSFSTNLVRGGFNYRF
jgi:outer membrane immunogenic protein